MMPLINQVSIAFEPAYLGTFSVILLILYDFHALVYGTKRVILVITKQMCLVTGLVSDSAPIGNWTAPSTPYKMVESGVKIL